MNKSYRNKTSATRAVYEVIDDFPGISTPTILEILCPVYKEKTVRRALDNLRDNRRQIVNRGGGTGYPTEWYVVKSFQDPYECMAEHILKEMKGMRHGEKVQYLSECLRDGWTEKS